MILRWTLGHIAGGAVTTPAFWESVAAVAYVAVHYGLPPVVALRERRRRTAGALR